MKIIVSFVKKPIFRNKKLAIRLHNSDFFCIFAGTNGKS